MPRARKGETAAEDHEDHKAKKTRKRSAPEAGQKEHVASHSGSTDKLVAGQTVDGKHKRSRAETGARPKKNRKRDSTDYMDHTAVDDEPPGSHGSEATSKPPPMVVVPLPSGTAELLKDTRWLEHFKAVAESVVDVQIFTVKDTQEPSDQGEPEVFEVHSPNGQTNCTGKYYLLPGKVNEHSIWKKDGQDRWIYSGTDGTWLVGGPVQQKQGFACRSGLLHQAVLHKGQMPDKLLFGSWKRVDGKTWKEDPEISVKAAAPLLPGQPVQVTGLDGRNGWLGRLISRRQSDEGNFWQVQLATGQDELPEKSLQLKKIVQDEVWLTVLNEASTQRAVQMCEVLAATLVGDVVKFSHLATAKATGRSGHSGQSGHMVVGECPFLLPGKVQQRLGAAELCRFMEKFSVILGFEEKGMGQGGQGGQRSKNSNELQLSLLIFGPNPAPAVLALLGRIEELIPDCIRSIALDPEALEPPDAQFGISVCSRSLPAEKDWLQRLATAMQVQASTVGGVSILLGGRPEREKSLQLIQTADSGSSKVLPKMLEPHCASTRVPEATAQIYAVGKALEALKEELGVIAVWCVQTESATAKEVILDVREDLIPGTAVRAVYEDGDWYDATVLEFHPVSDMVDVQWEDASSSTVLIQDVKLKRSTDSQQRREREALLQTARRLAIFGPARERKIAVARVMVLVEEHCRGLWTEDLLQTVEELRGSTQEETSIDVKLCPFLGGPYPALHILKTMKGLKESLHRAALASGSYMCLLGKPAVLVVGNKQERSQGLDYLEWIAADKLVWETFSSSAKSWLEDEVQWSDGEDQFLLVMDDKYSLGFTTNGILKVRQVATASYSGSELCLSGSGRTIRIATDEGVVKRVFQLFLRSQLSKALGTFRGDTTTIETTFGQAVWLEPVELRTIERQTKTLVIVPQIDRSTSNWQPDASCKILVSGRETCREEAAKELAKCLESLANRIVACFDHPRCGLVAFWLMRQSRRKRRKSWRKNQLKPLRCQEGRHLQKLRWL